MGSGRIFRIIGRVVDSKTDVGVPSLRVEAIDKGLVLEGAVFTAVTDQVGSFTIEFKKGLLKDLFGEREALLFFKVFRDNELIADTQDSIIWSEESADQQVLVVVSLSNRNPERVAKPITIVGQVRDQDGTPISKAIVRCFVTTPEKEVLLGEAKTDSAGDYAITSEIDELVPANAQLCARVFDKRETILASYSGPMQTGPITVDVILTGPPTTGPNIVRGQVLHATGKPLESGTVRLISAIPRAGIVLGETSLTRGNDGRYQIEYAPGEFDPNQNYEALVVINVFDSQDNLLADSPLFRANPEEAVDLRILPERESAIPYEVHGQITKAGQPLSNALVRAFDEDITGAPLGETRSSSQSGNAGNYLIKYTVGPRNSNTTKPPNLVIAVFDGDEIIGKSNPLGRPATPDEVVDVDVPVVTPPDVFSIAGHVVDRNRPSRSVDGLEVEAWHKEALLNKLIGQSPTDPAGSFSITATREYFAKLSIPTRPDVQFRVYSQGQLINSEEPFIEQVESGRTDIVIEVGVPLPQVLIEQTIVSHLSPRLLGTPATGVQPDSPKTPQTKVIWVEAGDEVLVHLDSLSVRVLDGTLLVSLDLETDQTGRSPLVCAFALGAVDDPAGLVAVTDELPHGNPLLAARWGRAVQRAMWASLLGLVDDHAAEQRSAPVGLSAVKGALHLHAGSAIQVTQESTKPR